MTDVGKNLRLGKIEPAPSRRNVLALSGGGYRGLFSAMVLERLEAELRQLHPTQPDIVLRDRFSLVAGTSIGGLLACGLAMGVPAATLRSSLERNGGLVFPERAFKKTHQFTGYLYDPETLAHVVRETLGANAKTSMDKVPHPLLVTSVSWVAAGPRLFRSLGLAGPDAPATSLEDVCLATAAAPTYFPAHLVGGDPLVDGGLIANAPDTVALAAALKLWNVPLSDVNVLSIGTAGTGSGGMQGSTPQSGKAWISGGLILDFMMAAQERLTIDTCRTLLGDRYLRINHTPGGGQQQLADLDVVNVSMTNTLKALGEQAFDDAKVQHGAALRAFLA